jgi:hypothetical protein
MVFERKSAVSAKNTWFRPKSPLLSNRRRFRNLDPKTQSSSRLGSETIAVKSRNSRHSWIHFSGFRRNNVVNRTLTPETSKKSTAYSHEQSSTNVPMMSNSATSPVWLLRLYTVNRYSSILAFLLIVATLIVYGWTVYSQELWSQSYRKLQSLQRNERQLNTANATLTSKMAQEAETPGTELVSPTSERTIFLPPASSQSTSSFSTSQPEPEPRSPLGY